MIISNDFATRIVRFEYEDVIVRFRVMTMSEVARVYPQALGKFDGVKGISTKQENKEEVSVEEKSQTLAEMSDYTLNALRVAIVSFDGVQLENGTSLDWQQMPNEEREMLLHWFARKHPLFFTKLTIEFNKHHMPDIELLGKLERQCEESPPETSALPQL